MREFFLGAALLLCGAVASAAMPFEGYYVGLGVGQATVELEGTDADSDLEGDDTAFRVIAGYRIFRYLGVEAFYNDYGAVEDEVFGLNIGAEFRAFGIAAIGMIPLDTVDLFGKIGIARWDGTLEDVDLDEEFFQEENFDPMLGIGVQWRIGQVALRAEVEGQMLSFDDDGDSLADGDDWLTMFSIAATWTF